MQQLQHDPQGFLIGDAIHDIRLSVEILKGIRADIAAIKSASIRGRTSGTRNLGNLPPRAQDRSPIPAEPRPRSFSSSGAQSQGGLPSRGSGTAEPAPRGTQARRSAGSGPAADNARAGVGAGAPRANQAGSVQPEPFITDQSPVLPNARRVRDARGRFVGGDTGETADAENSSSQRNRNERGRFTSNNEGEERAQRTLLSGLADRIADSVSVDTGLEEVDPTIKAFNEVAQPLARGYQVLAGDDKSDDRWYRKIFSELRLFRRDETVFNRAANRSLRNLEDGQDEAAANASGDGGFMGIIGGGLSALLMGLVKKFPLIAGLLGSIGVTGSVLATENNETLTRQQKDESNGKVIGGLAGTIGGMVGGAKLGAMAGSFIAPGIGTAIGGLIGGAAGAFFGDQAGQVLGEVTGYWVNELREADIPGKITSAWNAVVENFKIGWQDIKKKWVDFVDKAVTGWEQFTGMLKDAYEGLKALPVIGPAIQAAEGTAKKAAALAEKGIEEAQKLPAKAQEKLNQGVEWAKENTTLGRSISAISGGIRGVLNASGKTRILQHDDGSIETREGGTRAWRNNNPGNIRYGDFAKGTGAKGADKDGFAIFPSYNMGRNAKESLIFEGKNYKNKSLTDAIARYAPPNENDTASYQKAVLSAVGGDNKRMSDYTPEERSAILSAMERVEGFKPGSVSISRSVMATVPVQNAPTQSVSAPSPAIPSMPKPPAFAEAPQVITPIASDTDSQRFNVTVENSDVGQNLSDRRIGHLVTGGLGGA